MACIPAYCAATAAAVAAALSLCRRGMHDGADEDNNELAKEGVVALFDGALGIGRGLV